LEHLDIQVFGVVVFVALANGVGWIHLDAGRDAGVPTCPRFIILLFV
jgi:hypothetical protein